MPASTARKSPPADAALGRHPLLPGYSSQLSGTDTPSRAATASSRGRSSSRHCRRVSRLVASAAGMPRAAPILTGSMMPRSSSSRPIAIRRRMLFSRSASRTRCCSADNLGFEGDGRSGGWLMPGIMGAAVASVILAISRCSLRLPADSKTAEQKQVHAAAAACVNGGVTSCHKPPRPAFRVMQALLRADRMSGEHLAWAVTHLDELCEAALLGRQPVAAVGRRRDQLAAATRLQLRALVGQPGPRLRPQSAQHKPCPLVRNGTDRNAPEVLGAGGRPGDKPLLPACRLDCQEAQEDRQCVSNTPKTITACCKAAGFWSSRTRRSLACCWKTSSSKLGLK